MEITTEKKCPKCCDTNVNDTGHTAGNRIVERAGKYKKILDPIIYSIFWCKNCEESFKLKTCAK